MSEQKHTPEPWSVAPGRPWHRQIHAAGEPNVIAVVYTEAVAAGEANARRIVACVNACRGVPEDALKILEGSMGEVAALAVLGPLKGVCSWCGLALYGEHDPPARMRAHQAECPEHPMRGVERQRDALLEHLEAVLALYDEALASGRSVTLPGTRIDAIRAAVAGAKGA